MTINEFLISVLELSKQSNHIYHLIINTKIEEAIYCSRVYAEEVNRLASLIDKKHKNDLIGEEMIKAVYELQLTANILDTRLSSLNIKELERKGEL